MPFFLTKCRNLKDEKIEKVECLLEEKISGKYKIVNVENEIGIGDEVDRFDIILDSSDYVVLIQKLNKNNFDFKDSIYYRNVKDLNSMKSVILYNKTYRIHYSEADL